ncbi:MAG: beta-glucosidase [Leifsonia xyli]|nr:MAG: beta-glucosidase [Leifsonia xyli]
MNADIRFPYQDASLPVEQRIDDLLSRMSPEDKAGMLFHPHGVFGDPEQPDPWGRPSIGHAIREARITHFAVMGSAEDARGLAEFHNQLQRIALEHPLGIPVTLSSDPRHSADDNVLTSNESGAFSRWPEQLGFAALRSEEVMERHGEIVRREYLATGLRLGLHPQIDLATEPRWARIVGTLGEDAELAGRLGAAYIRGLQGPRLGPDSVAAMTKHFPGGGPQKDGLDPHFGDGREQVYPGGMFDYHLKPFLEAIEAGTAQMMPYYGMPVDTEWEEVGFAFNKGIITTLLRERLGFDGVVCTDWTVITGIEGIFPAKAWGVESLSHEERVLKLLDAGVDQFGGEDAVQLVTAPLGDGRIDEARIDVSVRRLLRDKFRLGLFDERRLVDADAANALVGAPDAVEAGLDAQRRSLVLLQNDGELLPLERGITVYAEGVAPEAFAGFAEVTDDPAAADVAIVRLASPDSSDPALGFLGSLHKGGLDFSDEQKAHLAELSAAVPTVLDVFLARPAILTGMLTPRSVLGSFATADRPFVEVLFGEAAPEGALPFELPRSMAAVEQSRSDVPFDSADPLFPFGHGLRYAR